MALRIAGVTHPDMRGSEGQSTTITIHDDGDAGTLGFESSSLYFLEGSEARPRVSRRGGSSSTVSVAVRIKATEKLGDGEVKAEPGVDFLFVDQTLTWGDGQNRTIDVYLELLDNEEHQEKDRVLTLELYDIEGGAAFASATMRRTTGMPTVNTRMGPI